MKKTLTTRAADYNQWYLDVIEAADLAEHSDVKGAMVIKPYGYAIWERMQKILDERIKEHGVQNAYFPLLIPKSFLTKEASHVEGFAKECAVVTHYRLKMALDGKSVIVDPEAKLEEELIIRPTSETVMYSTFSRWIKSWRDLPLQINQWANVMRWEMRTRLFLRTSEFLWQEGHTAHATYDEAEAEARWALSMYEDFTRDVLAMSVVPGMKTESEKFAGADHTFTIEAMMQDGKALQAGTSHNLGQNFAKAFEVKFLGKENTEEYVYQTSWGVSTRMIGGLIMSHSDDDGLVLPPRIAPHQVVIIPIYKTDEERVAVEAAAHSIAQSLKAETMWEEKVRVHVDTRDNKSFGEKTYEWLKKGVPVRIEIGPRDVANNSCMMMRRDRFGKNPIELGVAVEEALKYLILIQHDLLEANMQNRLTRTHHVDSYDELKSKIEEGGFFLTHWCGDNACEKKVKEELKATTRCIPLAQENEEGTCVVCSKPSQRRVIFARAY
ncbi:MAG: proline--tRNA ligase [Candidatus Kerfeldbacteria bacterium]|nr:proline--tRNA ligase [Candidatus Kerfeldbacteria bacterium]